MKAILLNLSATMKTVSLTLCLLLAAGLLPAASAVAATPCPSGTTVGGSSKNQVLGGFGQVSSDCSGSKVQSVVKTTISSISWIIGIIAIVVVLMSAFKYITSGGESNKVAEARRTLVYALIALVIAALAQVLVHFVINQATG